MTILRTCIDCGTRYVLDAQEIIDQTYSPLCTDCLRRHVDAPPESRPGAVPEEVLGELN